MKEPKKADPIELMFGGMEKLGPGSDEDTLTVLKLVPKRSFDLVVDAGAGSGRQTLALARELGTPVHAVDNHQPFLDSLANKASHLGLQDLIKTHCGDMANIGETFSGIDLLWCEGAAYNIGFENAVKKWHGVIADDGYLVVNELCWLKDDVPGEVQSFFQMGYPDMKSLRDNQRLVEAAGFKVLATHTLPDHTWHDGYYDLLQPRATMLTEHEDETVREFAKSTLEEIEIFGKSEQSYGYVFFVLSK